MFLQKTSSINPFLLKKKKGMSNPKWEGLSYKVYKTEIKESLF